MRSSIAWLVFCFGASSVIAIPFLPEKTSSDSSQHITDGLAALIELNSDAYLCLQPKVVLLWFVAYIAVTTIASLALGTATFRKYMVASRKRYLGPMNETAMAIVSALISVGLQIAATLSTGVILRADDHQASLHKMALAWFARPLATPIIIWLTMINIDEYRENSFEAALLDTIYGLPSISLFASVAHVTNAKNPRDVPRPARLARAGSALGILHFIITLVIPGVLFLHSRHLKRKPTIAIISASFGHCALRFCACWLLWAGLLYADETAFCPKPLTMKKILVLWLFISFIDQFWRAIAGRDRESGGDD
ncbi:hypothetical protein GP486_000107 [Trichoglossum hirsutum]|uniref:Uncharacterized protein n=1 Tax=Trichoglossum hirsutum TaxID=265104 RepID=A0A9P8LJB0_9PEZI|nr:hypothetical protein GP486_000107 [Trichoglossum hirsutum]